MNSSRHLLSIPAKALLVKKLLSFLELAQLVLRQESIFFPQNSVASLRKKMA
jgi:hypothetical protein